MDDDRTRSAEGRPRTGNHRPRAAAQTCYGTCGKRRRAHRARPRGLSQTLGKCGNVCTSVESFRREGPCGYGGLHGAAYCRRCFVDRLRSTALQSAAAVTDSVRASLSAVGAAVAGGHTTCEGIMEARNPLLASPQGGVAASSRKYCEATEADAAGVGFLCVLNRKTTPASRSAEASRHLLGRSATPPCGDARRGIRSIPIHSHRRYSCTA